MRWDTYLAATSFIDAFWSVIKWRMLVTAELSHFKAAMEHVINMVWLVGLCLTRGKNWWNISDIWRKQSHYQFIVFLQNILGISDILSRRLMTPVCIGVCMCAILRVAVLLILPRRPILLTMLEMYYCNKRKYRYRNESLINCHFYQQKRIAKSSS